MTPIHKLRLTGLAVLGALVPLAEPANAAAGHANLCRAHPRRVLVVVVALVVLAAVLASASSAAAEPRGVFTVFNQCPTEVSGVALCSSALLTSGEFSIGTVRIPVEKTLTLQLGDLPTGNPENEKEYFGVPAKNGESLSKTELNIPGGLLGMSVTASPELVASKKNQVIFNLPAFELEEGTALTLALRLHLKSVFLGSSCYVGSEASPLQLHLTTGETHPPEGFKVLHGSSGAIGNTEEENEVMVRVTGDSLVDDAFAAPGAEGCGALNSLLDEKLKIPNRAGENTAVLGGELSVATPSAVIASEGSSVAPSSAPPVPGGLPASDVTQSTATLNGTLRTSEAPVDYHFEYGTTTRYGQIAPIPELYTPIASETFPVSQAVGGLQAGTTYHYRLVVDNPSGVRVVGPVETFTTVPIPAPAALSGGASGVGVGSAMLSGTVISQPVALDTLLIPSRKANGQSTKHGKKKRKKKLKASRGVACRKTASGRERRLVLRGEAHRDGRRRGKRGRPSCVRPAPAQR